MGSQDGNGAKIPKSAPPNQLGTVILAYPARLLVLKSPLAGRSSWLMKVLKYRAQVEVAVG